METPARKIAGTGGFNWLYRVFVNHHNTGGLGAAVSTVHNRVRDEPCALQQKESLRMLVPYCLSFGAREVERGIDNQKLGCKGQALGATRSVIHSWHQVTVEGSSEVLTQLVFSAHPLAE